MPLDRLVLLVLIVLAAAGATIWVGWLFLVTFGVSPMVGLGFAIPTALVAYILWRVIADRIGDAEDDHYDRIEK